MNARKNTDYSELFAMLDQAMLPELPEMKLYFMIGSCVGSRQEKGAAVAAAEYLQAKYPDAKGFSARNIRRMRDFYLTYADDSVTLTLAEKIGWAKNVVILESGGMVYPRCPSARLVKAGARVDDCGART